ncbi:MAG: histidine kinase [Saprospiraceae bacterium]
MHILKKQSPNLAKKYIFLAALFSAFVVVLQLSNTGNGGNIQVILGHIVLFTSNYLVWALMIDYIYGAIQPIIKWELEFRPLLEMFTSLIILAIVHVVVTNIIYYSYLGIISDLTIEAAYQSFRPYLIRSTLSRFLDLSIISFLLKIVDTSQTVQKQKLQVIALENQLHISQLETLRAQVNPHFLFNTMHTLHALIGYDNVKAKSMIIKVNVLLRKMLNQNNKHLIPLEEELEYFRNYLEIEQERFNDRLQIEFDVDENTHAFLVPSLMLQPLIENAFKHGISLIEGKGVIKLSTKMVAENLVVKLSNTLPKKGHAFPASSTKVGLSNLKNRLEQLFSENYLFSTLKKDGLFIVQLTLKA